MPSKTRPNLHKTRFPYLLPVFTFKTPMPTTTGNAAALMRVEVDQVRIFQVVTDIHKKLLFFFVKYFVIVLFCENLLVETETV